MEVTPTVARPGDTVALSFPPEHIRGYAFTFERWTDDEWRVAYYLFSDRAYRMSWWSVDDPEAEGWDDIGFLGQGPDHVMVPDTAPDGTYRVCTASHADRACALLHVAS